MKAAVLGAGVMGATIAAHFANVGIDTLLLDVVPRDLTKQEEQQGLTLSDRRVRNRLTHRAVDQLTKVRPAPLYTTEVATQIQIGNLEDDLWRLTEVDWIVEVVVEQLAVKQQILAKVEQYWREGTIVSSNTSGISLHEMVKDRSSAFRAHFLGTHFFNPPRYMRLLEVIPTKWTSRSLVEQVCEWGETRLGKGVVLAKDTPNFIANRIGTYGIQIILQEMEKVGLRPDQVDAITGRLMGRPKSATFRTLDLVGLDTYRHVVNNVLERSEDVAEQSIFQTPEYIEQMIARGCLGKKSGRGFYFKQGKEITVLDVNTLTYIAQEPFTTASMVQAKRATTLADRLKIVHFADDLAGRFAWEINKRVLLYAAQLLTTIAEHPRQIDQAMRWGFNWDLGPFELWEVLGLTRVADRMKKDGEVLPTWVEALLATDQPTFYPPDQDMVRHLSHKVIPLTELRQQGHVIEHNQGGTLLDLGDGIAYLDFHSPKGAIGSDFISLLQQSLDIVDHRYQGLVISSEAPHFCVGANLMLMLLEAQAGNWLEIDMFIRNFQQTLASVRRLAKPVVVAPYGRTLGGGVELCLPADHVQASAETYFGLVETAVGLIPAGGGCTEMLYRFTQSQNVQHRVARQESVNQLFQHIALATVSTSAANGRQLGYLRDRDGITIQRDHLLYNAKQQALTLSETGYCSQPLGRLAVVGTTGYSLMKMALYDFQLAGKITPYDAKIASKLAYVLAGGDLPEGTEVTAQYLLDLERESFLQLIGEPNTQARMQYMLRKGKPLRN